MFEKQASDFIFFNYQNYTIYQSQKTLKQNTLLDFFNT